MKNLNYSLIVVLCLLSSVSLFSQNTRIPERQIDVESELVRFRNFFDRLSEEEITQKGSGYKPFKRWEWFISKRTDTGGTIPFGARWNVFQDILENRANSPQLALDADWQSLGPVTGTVYSAGRMLDIALDPNNPDIIWAGAASGGIWRSPDAGASWTPMDDYLPTLAVGCVLTHNTDSNIIYIGTGEGNFNADAVFGVGVLKSIDGGTTWNTTGLSWNMADHAAVNEMVMHPQNPDIIIATTRNGVYRTADAGGSWTQTLSFSSDEEDAKDIALDPDNPDNVFVSLGYMWGANSNGIYKSTDNGLTWTRLSTGLPAASTNIGRIAIAMHAANPLVLYAAYTGSYYHNGSALLGVYKTVDGGANWTQQSTSPNFYNKQGWYNNIIAAHPTDPATVYVGGVYLYKSTNSGVDWSSISSSIHVDQHAIQFHPENPEIVYVGNDGGMYKTLNGGSSWITLNDGLTTMQFYAMGTDPNDGAVAFGGTQDNGTNRITSPTWTHVLGADGGECIVDYSNSDVVYAEYQLGNHFRSTDGGDSWKQINSGLVGDGPWVTPVEMDPVDPYTLYTISNHNLYKTTNQGTNWTLLYDAPEDMDTCIRVAHSDNQTIYASGSRVIYRTTDGGSSWTDVTPSEYISNISSIAVHPTQSQVLYICSSTWNATMRIAKSTDGGTSWTNITHNLSELPCNSIVIDPVYPNHIYVGTDIGVYLSTDAGASWNEWSTGLPNVHIDELEIHATWRFIYAATHGRGMYVSPLYEPGDLVTQEISFISGWNWFSVNVENDNMNPNTVLSSIEPNGNFIKDQTSFATYYDGVGWYSSNGLDTISPESMYMIRMNAADILSYQGRPVEYFSRPIDLSAGWNWIGYLPQAENDINDALADIAPNGVFIKNQTSFATYYDGIGWYSSNGLDQLVPGLGYMLKMATADQLIYATPPDGAAKKRERTPETISMPLWAIDNHKYEHSMAITGVVRIGEKERKASGLVVGAFVKNECRGIAQLVQFPHNGRYEFDVLVHGVSGENLKFRLFDVVSGSVLAAEDQISFEENGILGDGFTPIVLQFSNQLLEIPETFRLYQNHPNPFNPFTTIAYDLPQKSRVHLRIYDIRGQRVKTLKDGDLSAGHYEIQWDSRNERGVPVVSGLYFYELNCGDFVDTKKMVLAK